MDIIGSKLMQQLSPESQLRIRNGLFERAASTHKRQRKRDLKIQQKISSVKDYLEISEELPEFRSLKPRHISRLLGVETSLVHRMKSKMKADKLRINVPQSIDASGITSSF